MELIRKLGTRKNEKNKIESWGLFKCPFCLQEVEKRLSHGRVCQSCGCVRGKLTSKGLRGKLKTKEHRLKISEASKGKIATLEARQKMSKAKKGVTPWNKGIPHTEETKEKLKQYKGKFTANWRGGVSFEPYSPEFNSDFKQQILERDNYTCQFPDCLQEESINLHIHHIDYNKKNNLPENVITLCAKCHGKSNFNRIYWKVLYQNIIIGKF